MSVWRVRLLMVALCLWLACFPMKAAGAQEGDTPALRLMETVFGTVDDSAPEARWQFEAEAGDKVSVLAQALGGELDPFLQITDSDGRLVAESDDVAYPDNLNAALEGIEMPRSSTYTITVTRFAGGVSQGDFALTLLPAYANPVFWESFSDGHNWSATGSDLVTVEAVEGQLQMTPTANNALVWAAPEGAAALPLQAYLQAVAQVENAPDYWEYGLIFRQTSAINYYLFAVSSRGDWAFLARAGASTWLHFQDWTEHPALRDLPPRVTLGVLMDGQTFSFYVEGVELATLTADAHNEPGTIAVSTGTVDRQEEMPVVRFDNVLATVPLPRAASVEQATGEPLAVWEAREAGPIIEELVAQGLIPEGGGQTMLVPESFTTTSRPGMQFLALGQGRQQADFVMGTTILPESDSAENGCGLTFRHESDGHYSLFFVDGVGGYGLAEWANDRFDPAFYALRETPGGDAPDRVVLVAQGERVWVYLNGQLLTAWPSAPVEGSVGIAALSFDGTYINCVFRDTWLWTWQ